MPPTPPAGSGGGRGRGRRKGLIVGGSVVGLAAVAGGAFAVYQLGFATGPQPAEALPASTVGYVSIDLDPSGKQKLEALETLKKFPAFNDNVDVDEDDDLRAKLFELAQKDGLCPGVDFGDDIEPWLGDRFGFAAVDVGEKLAPDSAGIAPVGVVQIKDADDAEAGLEKLLACEEPDSADGGSVGDDAIPSPSGGPEPDSEGAEASSDGGWSIQGDWVVIAESTEVAEAVTSAAQDDALADDDDYQKWTDEAGDPGIVSAYIAPEAGAFIADAIGGLGLGGGYTCSSSSSSSTEPAAPSPSAATIEPPTDGPTDLPELPSELDDFGDDEYDQDCTEEGPGVDEETQAVQDSLKDFDGAAVTVRFEDGGLEVESASSVDYLNLDKLYSSDQGDDVVAGLPGNTAIAFGLGFEEGWFTTLTDYLESSSGGVFDIEDGIEAIEQQTGLQLPEDAETLAGESAAVAVSGDVDFSADSPQDQPVGVKVQGDADAITGVLDKLLGNVGDDDLQGFGYQADGDHVAGSFSDDWTKALLADGDLGDNDDYQDVVSESDKAAAVLFVNFNEGDWLERAVQAGGGDQELLANLEPLKAAGMSAWTDDDVSHSVIKITTD